MKLQGSYFRIQLQAKTHKLVEGQALGPSQQLAAKLYRHPFLQGVQLSMLPPVEFGHQHLKFGEVESEFLLPLLQTEELGAGGGSGVWVTEGGFEDPDDVIGVVLLECPVLDKWEYLCLGSSFQSVESVTHS